MKKLSFFLFCLLLTNCNQTKGNVNPTKNEEQNNNQKNKQEKSEIIEGISNHWYEVKFKNDENIIFVPCDYQNTEFIFKKNGQKIILETIEGQDGFEYDVLSVTNINEYTKRIKVLRNIDNVKFSYYVQKIDENNAIWTKGETYECDDCDWSNQDLDKLDLEQKSIRMVNQEGKNFYKIVKAPPCLE